MKKLLLAVLTVFTLQSQAQCWKEVAIGGEGHTIAIKDDGTMWCWGNNSYFQLGLGADAPQVVYEPVQIGTDNDWKQVSASFSHNLAIKNDGTLWVWGYGVVEFSLGINNEYDFVPIPTKINNDTDWKFAEAGKTFSMAIKTDGTLWSWGRCYYGELGHGYPTGSWYTPHKIGQSSDWASVSAGLYNVKAIKTDGTLWSWGQIGNIGESQTTPAQFGNHTDWATVNACSFGNIALKNNGTLWSWGSNPGQLGNGTVTGSAVPTQVGSDTWLSIGGAFRSFFCIKSDGTLWAWGRNDYGQIQYNEDQLIKEIVLIGGSYEWDIVAAGSSHTVAVKSGGTLVAWGNNSFGQLGTGNTNPQTEQFTVSCSTTASLNENTLAQISLYPNPASSMLTLANAENLTFESLSVTDMTGKVVMNQTGNNPQLNVEKLPAGMYFLNVSAQEGSQHLKFIKE